MTLTVAKNTHPRTSHVYSHRPVDHICWAATDSKCHQQESELISEPEQAGTVNALLMLFENAGGIVLALLVQGLIASTTAAVAVLLVGALAAIPFASLFPAYTDRSSTS